MRTLRRRAAPPAGGERKSQQGQEDFRGAGRAPGGEAATAAWRAAVADDDGLGVLSFPARSIATIASVNSKASWLSLAPSTQVRRR